MLANNIELKLNEKNPNWKGDNVSYGALHKWVRRKLNKPEGCASCGSNMTLDLANISNEYKRDLSDWEWLCRKCHMIKDGRLKSLILRNGTKRISSSKYKGVTWNKKNEKWIAQTGSGKFKIHIGIFKTEVEAANAYINYKPRCNGA